jgi:prepilin-type N-terminal cleavage/methylation domain-containing protein
MHPSRARAFTLIELLVVMTLISGLAGLLLPALGRARERAKVIRVHAELYGIGLALAMYADDYAGRLPPVRVNCNSDLAGHWCQLPVELAALGYLPRGRRAGREADLEDLFHRGYTYKYAAPGPQLLNGDPVGNYRLWVPDDAPAGRAESGRYYAEPGASPVRWVVWSVGPRPDSPGSRDPHAPLIRRSWYQRAGGGGVIVRFATRDGRQYKSP